MAKVTEQLHSGLVVGHAALNRRRFLILGVGVAAVGLAGCGRSQPEDAGASLSIRHASPALASAGRLDDPQWFAQHGMDTGQYQAVVDRLIRDGFRPTDVCGYADGGQARYATIWEKSPGPEFVARHGLTADQYQTEFDRQNRAGFRLVRVSGYRVGATTWYAAIWYKIAGPEFVARHGLTADQYQAEFDRQNRAGFQPVEVCGYDGGGLPNFAAMWAKIADPEFVARHGLTADQYQTEFDRQAAAGMWPKRVSVYAVNSDVRYAAIWEPAVGIPGTARHNLGLDAYQSEFDKLNTTGFRPTQVSITGGPVRPVTAGLWQKRALSPAETTAIDKLAADYLRTWNAPGLSVAIAHQGQLVYAQGYGVADRASGEKVTPATLFRIASISKPITSVAVMGLIERGRIRLADTVFGAKGILGNAYGKQPYGPNIESITVEHLLEHTTGWGGRNDPMFAHLEMDQVQLISWMLDNTRLASTPGQNFDYSNFGYCVLGRIIEKVTGSTYEAYVRQAVLTPCGITAMAIAGDTVAARRPGEAVYSAQTGDGDPYGFKVSRMDSHGGWLATPTDLLRFAVRVDGFPTKPDILNAASIATMTTASSAFPVPTIGNGYAKGWFIHSSGNWWHDGALPGTSSILVRTADGFCCAAIANTRDGEANKSVAAIDQLQRDIRGAVSVWPGHDLF